MIEIVGSSQVWDRWEAAHGICSACSGDGDLAVTTRAAYEPEKYPDELRLCEACGGSGRRGTIIDTGAER